MWALVASWGDVVDALPRVGAARYVAATLVAIVAGIGLALGWKFLLDNLSHDATERGASPLGTVEAVAVFSASQLGKYLPGSVWPVVAQMSLARRHGIARRNVAAAFVVHLLLLVVSAVLLAIVTLPWVDPDELRSRWWVVLAVPLIGLILVPSVQRWLLQLAGRLFRRELAIRLPRTRAVGATIAVSLLTYLCFGLHVALLAWPLSDESALAVLAQAAGGFALAWAAGFLVVIAPAGLGVREVVLTVTMGAVLVSADATAVAVLSRTSIVFADLVLGVAGIAALGGRRRLLDHGAGSDLAQGAGSPLAAAQQDEHV